MGSAEPRPVRASPGTNAWLRTWTPGSSSCRSTAAFSHLTAAEVRGWWLPAPSCIRSSLPSRRAATGSSGPGCCSAAIRNRWRCRSSTGCDVTTPRRDPPGRGPGPRVLDLVLMGDSALRLEPLHARRPRGSTARQHRRGAPLLRTVIPLARQAQRVAVGVDHARPPSGRRDRGDAAAGALRPIRPLRRAGGPADRRDPAAARVRRCAPSGRRCPRARSGPRPGAARGWIRAVRVSPRVS